MGRSGGQAACQLLLDLLGTATDLRRGIERIRLAGRGALVVLGSSEQLEALLTGGFGLSGRATPQRLAELAKMDGAIVVSADGTSLVHANGHLTPQMSTPTSETGTRHRTADRVAQQTGLACVAVSERLRTITVYHDGHAHLLAGTRARWQAAPVDDGRPLAVHLRAAMQLLEAERAHEVERHGRSRTLAEQGLALSSDLGSLAAALAAYEGAGHVADLHGRLAGDLARLLWRLLVVATAVGIDLDDALPQYVDGRQTALAGEPGPVD